MAPGTYKLTVVFSAGKHFGKFETPIQIVPYLGKTITLGGVVLSTVVQKLDQNSNQLGAMLVEDRTPLIANGVQITPAAKYQFKKSDNVGAVLGVVLTTAENRESSQNRRRLRRV